MCLGDAVEAVVGGGAGVGAGDAAHRAPGQERDAHGVAECPFGFAGAERGGELVLYGYEASVQDAVGEFDLRGVGVGDAGHPDLAGVEQVAEGADGVLVGHVLVRLVQEVQVDRLDAQPRE